MEEILKEELKEEAEVVKETLDAPEDPSDPENVCISCE